MAKPEITQDTVQLAVVEKRVDNFEDACHTFKKEIKAELKDIGITSTQILLKLNTLETKQKVHAAAFGTAAGFIGALAASIIK